MIFELVFVGGFGFGCVVVLVFALGLGVCFLFLIFGFWVVWFAVGLVCGRDLGGDFVVLRWRVWGFGFIWFWVGC